MHSSRTCTVLGDSVQEMSASLHSVSRQTGVKTLPFLVVSNKGAFQSNANLALADSACFIVKKFKVSGGGVTVQ